MQTDGWLSFGRLQYAWSLCPTQTRKASWGYDTVQENKGHWARYKHAKLHEVMTQFRKTRVIGPDTNMQSFMRLWHSSGKQGSLGPIQTCKASWGYDTVQENKGHWAWYKHAKLHEVMTQFRKQRSLCLIQTCKASWGYDAQFRKQRSLGLIQTCKASWGYDTQFTKQRSLCLIQTCKASWGYDTQFRKQRSLCLIQTCKASWGYDTV